MGARLSEGGAHARLRVIRRLSFVASRLRIGLGIAVAPSAGRGWIWGAVDASPGVSDATESAWGIVQTQVTREE